MTKVAVVLGSPRNPGNSQTIAARIASVAEQAGAQVQTFDLYRMKFHGCIACMGCKTHADECVLKDDLTLALRAMHEADVLIMASPVYFGEVTGELKRCIDRMYSLMPPDYLNGNPTRLSPGKKCVFVLTQGSPSEEAFGGVFERYATFFGPSWFGYEMHLIRGIGLRMPTDAAGSEALMAEAEALGRKLFC